ALRNAKDAFLRQELRAIRAVDWLALLGRHVGDLLRWRWPARAHCADDMRHAPDRILVGDEEFVVAAPCHSIRTVEVLDMARDPSGLAFAVVPHHRHIAGPLLTNENILI